jgi:hypothetical protein
MEEEKEAIGILISRIILNIFIILIAIFIFTIYIKDKQFHTVPCYNMMTISLLLFLDNILRLIPTEGSDVCQYIQAFILITFDKLLLNVLTVQAIIYYLGVIKTQFYYANEKIIYIMSLIISVVISVILASLYISYGKVNYGIYSYSNDSELKRIIDPTFIGILIFVNLFCIIILLVYVSGKKREASKGLIEDLDYGHHFIRILLMFFVNILTFIEQYLIIYDALDGLHIDIDLLYLSTCLIIDLFYTINKTIYEETLKLFCHKAVNKPKNIKMEDDNSNAEDNGDTLQRSDSWEEPNK